MACTSPSRQDTAAAIDITQIPPSEPATSNAFRSATPLRSSSASMRHSHETHDLVRGRLASELNTTIEYNIPISTYIETLLNPSDDTRSKSLQIRVRATIEQLESADHSDLFEGDNNWKGCTDYRERYFLPGFCKLWKNILHLSTSTAATNPLCPPLELPAREYHENRTRYLAGSNAQRKVDFYACSSGGQLKWDDVLLLGEMKERSRSPEGQSKVDVQIAGYVREVFYSQPHRLFVHAFYICNSEVMLYRLDRCGALVSERFDMHSDWKTLVEVVLAYSYMSIDDLGFDLAFRKISQDNTSDTPDQVKPVADGQEEEPLMEPAPPLGAIGGRYMLRFRDIDYTLKGVLDYQKAVVGRATVCWAADSGDQNNFVIKRSWQQASQLTEERIYRLAQERKVSGLLDFCLPSNSSSTISVLDYVRRGISGGSQQSRRKRKTSSESETDNGKARKRSKTISGSANGGGTDAGTPDQMLPKIDRICVTMVFRNAVCTPLSSLTSPRQLLLTIRSALETHRSLYKSAGILHRDISAYNILATTSSARLTSYETDNAAETPAGVLIDFDFAIDIKKDLMGSGAGHRTGTPFFHALSVLQGAPNSYRADLESFFYVLCFCCCRFPEVSTREPRQSAHISPSASDNSFTPEATQNASKRPTRSPEATRRSSFNSTPVLALDDWWNAGDAFSSKFSAVKSQIQFRRRILGNLTPTYKICRDLLENWRGVVTEHTRHDSWDGELEVTRERMNTFIEEEEVEAEVLYTALMTGIGDILQRDDFKA